MHLHPSIIHFQKTYQRSNTLFNTVFFYHVHLKRHFPESLVDTFKIGVPICTQITCINLQQHKICNRDNKNVYAASHCVVKQLNISNIKCFNLFLLKTIKTMHIIF